MSPRQTVIEGYASLFGVPDLARDEVARGHRSGEPGASRVSDA